MLGYIDAGEKYTMVNGMIVRIICINRITMSEDKYPIIGLYFNSNMEEDIIQFTLDGKSNIEDSYNIPIIDKVFEVGQRWKARNGQVFMVEDTKYHFYPKYSMLCRGPGQHAKTYTKDGRYSTTCMSEWDLMQLVKY